MTSKPEDRTLWCRYELKYLISESMAAAVKDYLGPYIEPDYYTQIQPDGYYSIVSLYMDSTNFTLCKETLSGKKNRFKLRIRSYSDDLSSPRFMEIKRRANTVIIKSRARASQAEVDGLIAGQAPEERKSVREHEALHQYMLYTNSIQAKPAALIKYEREAFEGETDNKVRITFDRNLCCKVSEESAILMKGTGWHRVPLNNRVILEIKFTGRYPAWLDRMTKCFGLQARSVSKYALSIEQSCLLGYCAPRINELWSNYGTDMEIFRRQYIRW